MAEVIPRAMSVVCTDDELHVYLTDGRWISVPIAWFPRMAHATATERANFELLGDGQGIHSPDVDEDISVARLHADQPSMESVRAHVRVVS